MRLSLRIPLITLALTLGALSVLAIGADHIGARALRDAEAAALSTLLHTRVSEARHHVEDLYADVRVLADSTDVRVALYALHEAVEEMDDPQGTLQRAFIADNPFDDRSALVVAPSLGAYSDAHASIHPFLRTFREQKERADVYLVAPDGHVLYSVMKHADLGSESFEAPWSGTGLSTVASQAIAAGVAGYIAATDFEFYGPAEGEPAAFVGTPVLDDGGGLLGVVVIKIGTHGYNEIFLESSGLGETGHTFLVGSDLLLRSRNRFTPDRQELVGEIDMEGVHRAIDGETGSMETPGHDGEAAVVAYEPFTPFPGSSASGVRWAAIAERDIEEVELPAAYLRRLLALAFVGISAVAVVIGIATARGIVRPIGRMSIALRALARGEEGVGIPGRDRADEIGEMAGAAEVFKAVTEEATRTSEAKSRIADLSRRMQQGENLGELGSVVLDVVGGWIGAVAGACYVREDETERLALQAMFGVGDRGRLPVAVGPGDGITGEALRRRDLVVVDRVSEGHVRVESALGESEPATLVVVPFLSGKEVVGVAEFAVLDRRLVDSDRDTIEQAVGTIGLSLESTRRAQRTKELLEETRLQAEELATTNDQLNEQRERLEDQAQELRASEEELRSQQEELQTINEALGRRQVEVEEARAEAEQRAEEVQKASAFKTQFLANVSHELRTPLNSMLILARDLADNHDGTLSDEQVQASEIIHDSGMGLLRLINDILDLSKVEAGRMDLSVEDIELRSLVSTTERLFSHQAQERGLRFEVAVDEGVPSVVRADTLRVEQIIVNLVGNALKFTEEGEVTVGFSVPDRVPIQGATTADYMSISVRDTGIGIPADKLDSIFDSFRQAEGSTARRFGGTGLGLSISKELATLMGGTITADSEQGAGSTFTLFLPVRPASDPGAPLPSPSGGGAETPSASPPAVVSGTVLIVEDDPALRDLLVEVTEGRGLVAVTARSGAEAIMRAGAGDFDAVLLDLRLPDRDGWEVLERLKANPRTSEVPVHVLSEATDLPEARGRGAAGVVAKPTSRARLEEVIGSLGVLGAVDDRGSVVGTVGDVELSWDGFLERLAEDGVRVVPVDDGNEGLALVQHEDVACVVVDIDLPDMTAPEFLGRLGSTPAIVVTRRDLDDEESLALRAYTDSIIHIGPRAGGRILDEVELFLHTVRSEGEVSGSEGDAPGGFGGERVLVVDDDMRNLFALSTALRRKGLVVLMAQDGHKALSQLDANPHIDIVLMDVMMPGMDGLETTRRIRADARFSELPVVALTAKAMAGDREACLAAGATEYLTKPIDMHVLTGVIAGLLSGRTVEP